MAIIVAALVAASGWTWAWTRTRRQSRTPWRSRREQIRSLEKVVFINRCAKVVKGGRRFSFSALIVAGDRKGKVGFGFGKANEVSEAIRKATDAARKHLEPSRSATTPFRMKSSGQFGGGRVLLRPASPGTGVIAGGGVRAVVEAAGIKDVLAKSLGSSNPANVVKATLDALKQLRLKEDIYKLRGKTDQGRRSRRSPPKERTRTHRSPPRAARPRASAKARKARQDRKSSESDPALAS